MAGAGRLDALVRSARVLAGLSQAELAVQAGVTRQAISAIESGKAVPTTSVALRMARALGRRVEELFQLVDDLPRVEAELLSTDEPAGAPLRVQVADVGGRLVARPLTGPSGVALALTRANGLVRSAAGRGRATVELFANPALLADTVVIVVGSRRS